MKRHLITNQFRIVQILLVGLFVILMIGCAPQDKQSSESSQETDTTTPEEVLKPAEDNNTTQPEEKSMIDPANAVAVLETAKGNIEFEFYATDAPKASKNFIYNASHGYYRNEKFHNVDPLFIQAGSSFVNDKLPIEKSDHPLEKGTVLMITEEGSNMADGDEFMISKDTIALDEDWTILGKVTKGLDVLDSIEKDDKLVNITIRERNTTE